MKKQQSTEKESKTQWHRILGKLFELLFHALGVTVKVDFKLMSEPPRSDIFLLRCDSPTWTKEQRARLPDGIRNSRASHILIEFKFTESLNARRIEKVCGYDIFYRTTQGLADAKVATFILSSRTPRRALLKKYGYRPTKWPGVYRSKELIVERVTILVLNELADVPHNAYVKCFASRPGKREVAFELLKQIDFKRFPLEIMSFIVGLHRLILPEGGNEEMWNVEVTPQDVLVWGKEWREAVLASMPVEEVLSQYKPEEVLSQYKPEERLVGLKPEERLVGLRPEERLVGLKPEERLVGLKPEDVLSQYKPYLAEQKQQSERQAILRTIRRTLRIRLKLSDDRVEQLEKRLDKLDLMTLDELSEVALMVDELADFEAKLSEVEET
jgi:hypothetical protein